MDQEHPNEEVRQLLVKLADALCTWERNTGLHSVLILREEFGVCFRAMDGKPGIPDDVTDSQLLEILAQP